MKHCFGGFLVMAAMAMLSSGCAETSDRSDSTSATSLVVTPALDSSLMEGGRGVSFEIFANVAPKAEVTVSVSADVAGQVAFSTPSVSGYFFPNSKSIEVSCLEDYVEDNGRVVTLTFDVTSEDPAYHGKQIVRKVVCNDDSSIRIADDFCPDDPDKTEPGVCGCNVPDTAANLSETADGFPACLARFAALSEDDAKYGIDMVEPDDYFMSEKDGEQYFAVALKAQPEADVVIPVVSSDESEGVADVSELVFTPDNWSDPQIVTVMSVDDDEVDGDQLFSINLGPAQSEDPHYNAMVFEPLSFMTMDDEEAEAGLYLSTRTVTVHEGGTSAELYISLAKAPLASEDGDGVVTVKLVSSNKKEAYIDENILTFTADNWNIPQVVLIRAFKDDVRDGNKEVTFSITSQSTEVCGEKVCYNDRNYDPVVVTVVDAQAPTQAELNRRSEVIRIMAANITAGSAQSYDTGEGIRIFKGLKPDIVLIQEFNYKKGTISDFVKKAFGEDYSYVRGKGDIPNGIISRYPIIQSGAWESNRVTNRQWDWAVIDIPGDRELLAVSVHLHTSDNTTEMGPLRTKIDKKIDSDRKDYYVVIGGDFNQPKWNPIRSNFGSAFTVGKAVSDWPMDQLGDVTTNAKRAKQYDYLLCSFDFCKLETPTVIGSHSYSKGHVVDSRVYGKKNELKDIDPVQAKDSNATNMQHMAVVRDFEVNY